MRTEEVNEGAQQPSEVRNPHGRHRNARAARHGPIPGLGREGRSELKPRRMRRGACEEPGCQKRLISHAS